MVSILLLGCGRESASRASQTLDELEPAVPLKIAAVYNGSTLQFRFEFENGHPSWYHQYLVYENGRWTRYGDGSGGPDPDGFYEDRISILIDDGSVPDFAALGGFATVHPGMRGLHQQVPAEAVRSHPHLGNRLGASDVRKFIAESRTSEADPQDAWAHTLPVEDLDRLREEGVFLDLWQWRAHRSHPLGYADNGYVLEYRHGSSGRSPYRTNLDSETGLPLRMYEKESTGFRALRLETLRARGYSQEDPYYLSEDSSVPFDPLHQWQEGDALPHRLLQRPSGSRGAIAATGRYQDGAWKIRLTRSLETPYPRDSKSFVEGKTYWVAFAVHSRSTGSRHHHVSNPMSFRLGEEADLTARRVEGDLDAAVATFQEVLLFLPPDPTAPHP